MGDTPKHVRRPLPKDNEPRHFAVLHAAFRNLSVPKGEHGHYYEVARDDPLANEFRVQMLCEFGEQSLPLGSDRERAEMHVHALNTAFHFGRVHERRRVKDVRTQDVLTGRMGHRNRNEELMP